MAGLALVTGASSGIGFQLAKGLADRGYDIVGVGSGPRIEQVPQRLPKTSIYPVRADLATAAGVDAVWNAVEALQRPLDVAVLNAGRSLGGSFLDADTDKELELLSLNVTSQVLLAKHVARAMVERRRGNILITSSISATTPTPFESIYGPTRAFMYSFAEGLREELREHNVNVTALLPGPTATEFHDRAGMQNTAFGDNSVKNDPRKVARMGLEALFAGRDHVIGGDLKTRAQAVLNKFLPEETKARRFAKQSREQ